MTRINIIPPSELYDQHLVAEYREIFMVPGSLKRILKSKVGFQIGKVPPSFTLNKGHVYFFFNKGLYLENRYKEIIQEMKLRGMSPDPTRLFPSHVFPKELFNDWTPSKQEQDIARERIKLRLSQKPGWYRKTTY
jgi:deoxyribonuclease (pyrimidine dimer)